MRKTKTTFSADHYFDDEIYPVGDYEDWLIEQGDFDLANRKRYHSLAANFRRTESHSPVRLGAAAA
jgi:hypothetical protein